MQKNILLWDGLAVGCVFTGFLFTYGYVYNHFTVNELGVWLTAGLVFCSILFFTLMYRLIGSTFSRYRYIYAVEQFKKYHADEQWIAIGHDVFSNPLDKYLKELKNQCVFNGFGLLAVDKNFEPKVLITPAKGRNFQRKKKKAANLKSKAKRSPNFQPKAYLPFLGRCLKN